ncbi:MAG: hypothetical protein B6A08_18295 [Sorangiineae bacterium NIC37A_2]|nr:MAG: hypothetical protein B6A08_18295 [Sorangiineae bacterium NIC37A_2]
MTLKRVASLGALLAGLGHADPARAQACCSAAAPIAPGRLALHERALVGVQLGGSVGLGSFDGRSRFYGNDGDAYQIDTQTTLLGTVRVVPRLQVGLSAPLWLSFRGADGVSEVGGGLGDLGFVVRYDLLRNREYRRWPGIGLLASVSAPTGRAPEVSETALGSDVTGIGAFQASLGLWLERSFGPWLVTAAGWVAFRPARQVGPVELALAPEGSVLLALGHSFSEALGLSLSGTYSFEGDAQVDGAVVTSSARRKLRLSFSGSQALHDEARVLFGVFLDPPLRGLGQNHIPQAGVHGAFLWSFL